MDSLQRGALAAALVTNMAVMTVVGGGLGHQLDAWLNTAPALMVTGFGLGFTCGMVLLFRSLSRLDPDDDDDDQPPDSA